MIMYTKKGNLKLNDGINLSDKLQFVNKPKQKNTLGFNLMYFFIYLAPLVLAAPFSFSSSTFS